MRTDFDSLEDGAQIILHPNEQNPLHNRDVKAVFTGGYFFCEGSDPMDGPDYYMGDVAQYNDWFSIDRTAFN